MKQLTERNAADTAAFDPMFGALIAGQSRTQESLLKNTGDEPITSLKVWRVNNADLPGIATVTVNGVEVPEATAPAGEVPAAAVEVLTAPLAPGASVAVSTLFTNPAGATAQGLDSADLRVYMS